MRAARCMPGASCWSTALCRPPSSTGFLTLFSFLAVRYCSRSNTILGSVVNGLNKENLINSIPRCCNDTIHTSSQLVDVVIPPRQLWTQFFPNRSTLNPSLVSTLVKSNYNWRAAGASLHYDFTAAIQSLQQVSLVSLQAVPQPSLFMHFLPSMWLLRLASHGPALHRSTRFACTPLSPLPAMISAIPKID